MSIGGNFSLPLLSSACCILFFPSFLLSFLPSAQLQSLLLWRTLLIPQSEFSRKGLSGCHRRNPSSLCVQEHFGSCKDKPVKAYLSVNASTNEEWANIPAPFSYCSKGSLCLSSSLTWRICKINEFLKEKISYVCAVWCPYSFPFPVLVHCFPYVCVCMLTKTLSIGWCNQGSFLWLDFSSVYMCLCTLVTFSEYKAVKCKFLQTLHSQQSEHCTQ